MPTRSCTAAVPDCAVAARGVSAEECLIMSFMIRLGRRVSRRGYSLSSNRQGELFTARAKTTVVPIQCASSPFDRTATPRPASGPCKAAASETRSPGGERSRLTDMKRRRFGAILWTRFRPPSSFGRDRSVQGPGPRRAHFISSITSAFLLVPSIFGLLAVFLTGPGSSLTWPASQVHAGASAVHFRVSARCHCQNRIVSVVMRLSLAASFAVVMLITRVARNSKQ